MDVFSEQERVKYEKIWTHPRYRIMSPGHQEVHDFIAQVGPKRGESLNDYGAGPARATHFFKNYGLDVLAIDIAENASEYPEVPFLQRSLWDMNEDVRAAHYSYCCDVMEHIPPQFVATVIENIARRTYKAAWFRIATGPDQLGRKLIGQKLHLTVRESSWWSSTLARSFKLVEMTRMKGSVVVFRAS